jgi:uncharacterized protein YcfJ
MSKPRRRLDLPRIQNELDGVIGSRTRQDSRGVHEMNTVSKTSLAAAASAALLGVALPAGAAEYARVISSTPVTGSVAAPRQECSEGAQLVRQQPSGAGAVIGAIAGGVLGNQFGHGFGRAAATGLGAVAGSAIGNNVEANASPPAAVPVRSCRTVSGYENRVVGYDVVYEYNGQRYTTRLPNDPGARLAIDVRPVGDTQPERSGPSASYGAVPPAYAQVAPSYDAAPVYYDAAPAYYAPAPVYYPAPYYAAPYYVAPAAIGFGIGYWAGHGWHHGYRHWR